MEDDVLRAAQAIGFPEIEDLQDLDAKNGFQRWQRYVGPDGRRHDTAHRYLHPLLEDGKHPNIHVLVESKVVRVLFDEAKRAVGVEYTPNPEFQTEIGLTRHPLATVKARKLVVVTCGACGTPPVLERSGLGDSAILARAGVRVVEDLTGIGKGYQDHHMVASAYKTSLEPDQTFDQITAGRVDAAELVKSNDEKLGWNGLDVAGKIRPTEEEVTALGPEFRKAWDQDFKDTPNRPLAMCGIAAGYLGDPSSVPAGQYVSGVTWTVYPYSRGHIHITGPNLVDPLNFDIGFFNDAHDIDIKKQVWVYKKQREIIRRMDCFRGELASSHPKFPKGSTAALTETASPLTNVKDLKYSQQDDEAIEQFVRERVETTWHSMATCKMAPREQDGVVDTSLNVYGVTGLKIADMSIAPYNVSANICNTAMTIGEKAADIILADLKAHTP
jgi:alcohol oxidase